MTDLVFHKAEKYIEEDLEYYFSGERDIHSQVKPGQNIYSFTPDSEHLEMAYDDGKVGNLFFPFSPASVDRIYLGISFPLFANSWGAAFLRHLMTLVKPGGCVVLPVYPEMQASEKNYWSRSILENIFISRSRWKGMSNIWAENDGVMSMRIGRKQPPYIASTANYLLNHGSQSLVRRFVRQAPTKGKDLTSSFSQFHSAHWKATNITTIIEKIIQDHFGRKASVALCGIGPESITALISIECLLSPYINVKTAVCQAEDEQTAQNDWQAVADMNSQQIQGRLVTQGSQSKVLDSEGQFHVVSLINSFDSTNESANNNLVKTAWNKLAPGGLLISYQPEETNSENPSPELLTQLLAPLGEIKHYSSIAASEHKPSEEISHYSLLIEEELRLENSSKRSVFWVVQKT